MNSTPAANHTLTKSASAIFALESTKKKHEPDDSQKLVPSDVDLVHWQSLVENIASIASKDDDSEIDKSKFDSYDVVKSSSMTYTHDA